MLRSTNVILLSLGLVLACHTAYGKADPDFPRGCSAKTVSYLNDSVLLGHKPGEQTHRVYVFRNISSSPVEVSNIADPNSSAYRLSSTIEPHRWSAIIVGEDNYMLYCQDHYGSQAYPTACDHVLKACELRVAPVMQSAQGEYWVSENESTQKSLFRSIREHGIFP